MGYTNTTTHYSLPQYVATDKPKYLTDFNQTMDAIDTQMYANAQAAATADGKAVAAKDTADGAVTSIGTLNTQINGDVSDPSDRGLAGDVSDNSGAINTINSLIGNGTPTTTDKTIIGAINEIYADITGGGTAVQAVNVSYDNTTSGLSATNVEAAIDEVAGKVGDLTALDTNVKTDIVSAVNEVNDKLPTGTMLLVGYETFTATADTVKTNADLINEVDAAFLTMLAGAAADEKYEPIKINATDNNYYSMVRGTYYDNASASVTHNFTLITTNATRFYNGNVSMSNASTINAFQAPVGGTTTFEDRSAIVAIKNVTLTVAKYKVI